MHSCYFAKVFFSVSMLYMNDLENNISRQPGPKKPENWLEASLRNDLRVLEETLSDSIAERIDIKFNAALSVYKDGLASLAKKKIDSKLSTEDEERTKEIAEQNFRDKIGLIKKEIEKIINLI